MRRYKLMLSFMVLMIVLISSFNKAINYYPRPIRIAVCIDEVSLRDITILSNAIVETAIDPETIRMYIVACARNLTSADELKVKINQTLSNCLPKLQFVVKPFVLPDDSGFALQILTAKKKSHWTSSSGADMARFYLPSLFPNLNRLLYIDNDVLITCCLEEIWDTHIPSEKVIGIALDDLKWATETQFYRHYNGSHPLVIQHMRRDKDKNDTQKNKTIHKSEFLRWVPRYPNDGVLLIEIQNYNHFQILHQLNEIALANGRGENVVSIGTQQFTVLTMHGRWVEMTPRSNLRHFPDMARGFLMWFYFNGFIHYAGVAKPRNICPYDDYKENELRVQSFTSWGWNNQQVYQKCPIESTAYTDICLDRIPHAKTFHQFIMLMKWIISNNDEPGILHVHLGPFVANGSDPLHVYLSIGSYPLYPREQLKNKRFYLHNVTATTTTATGAATIGRAATTTTSTTISTTAAKGTPTTTYPTKRGKIDPMLWIQSTILFNSTISYRVYHDFLSHKLLPTSTPSSKTLLPYLRLDENLKDFVRVVNQVNEHFKITDYDTHSSSSHPLGGSAAGTGTASGTSLAHAGLKQHRINAKAKNNKPNKLKEIEKRSYFINHHRFCHQVEYSLFSSTIIGSSTYTANYTKPSDSIPSFPMRTIDEEDSTTNDPVECSLLLDEIKSQGKRHWDLFSATIDIEPPVILETILQNTTSSRIPTQLWPGFRYSFPHIVKNMYLQLQSASPSRPRSTEASNSSDLHTPPRRTEVNKPLTRRPDEVYLSKSLRLLLNYDFVFLRPKVIFIRVSNLQQHILWEIQLAMTVLRRNGFIAYSDTTHDCYASYHIQIDNQAILSSIHHPPVMDQFVDQSMRNQSSAYDIRYGCVWGTRTNTFELVK